MSWNIADNRNLFLKLKWKLGPYHVGLSTPKTFREKLTLTVVEMQQMPYIEKTDSKEEVFCLNWALYKGRRKACVNFQTDRDKLIIVVYRYRNSLYLKDDEVILKFTEYESHLAELVYLWSYIFIFYKGALYWMKQLFIINTDSVKNGCSLSIEHFPIVPGIEIVIWTQ